MSLRSTFFNYYYLYFFLYIALVVDNVTPEVVVDRLDQQGECISVLSSEGGLFDMLSGQYSKIVNIDVFLKGYSGDFLRVDRVTRESTYINYPRITIDNFFKGPHRPHVCFEKSIEFLSGEHEKRPQKRTVSLTFEVV